MPEKSVFGENWTRLGWIALIMLIPVYVIKLYFSFDLKWMMGLPFAFFYFCTLLSAILLPIFIFLQSFVILKLWIKQKTILLQQVTLFLVSIGLYAFATTGLWERLFDS